MPESTKSPAEVLGAEEDDAWTWLNGHVETCPADRIYSADEMVDAFMAGQRAIYARAAVVIEALEKTRERIQTWPIDDHEHCMCGSTIESHDMGSGHCPVSQGDHAVSLIVEEINAALRQASRRGGEA
ncbi:MULTISPECIES: hypothetical protein [unclassified Brevundimonas]